MLTSETATNISTRDTPATRMDGTPCDLTSDAIGLGAHLAFGRKSDIKTNTQHYLNERYHLM
jgi:hypothetical protein